jgi:transposase
VYLKTPSRIEALGIVFVMALLVYGMLEWRVRE